jgi:hypothetical protein
LEVAQYFYDPEKFKMIDGVTVIGPEEKEEIEKRQEELYGG